MCDTFLLYVIVLMMHTFSHVVLRELSRGELASTIGVVEVVLPYFHQITTRVVRCDSLLEGLRLSYT
jgi:hypothetical protein